MDTKETTVLLVETMGAERIQKTQASRRQCEAGVEYVQVSTWPVAIKQKPRIDASDTGKVL